MAAMLAVIAVCTALAMRLLSVPKPLWVVAVPSAAVVVVVVVVATDAVVLISSSA